MSAYSAESYRAAAASLERRAHDAETFAAVMFGAALIVTIAGAGLVIMHAPLTLCYLMGTLWVVLLLAFLVKGLQALTLHADATHANSNALYTRLIDAEHRLQGGVEPAPPGLPATGGNER